MSDNISILLVEEDSLWRLRFAEMREQLGVTWQVTQVGTLKEAESQLLENQFDLVVTELKSEKVDGLVLIRETETGMHRGALVVQSQLLSGEHRFKQVHFVERSSSLQGFVEYLKKVLQENGKKSPLEKETQKVDVFAFEVIRKGVLDYFTQKLKMDIGVDRLTLRKEKWLEGDVGASLQIHSRLFTGQLVLLMSQACFLSFSNHLLKASLTSVNEQNKKLLIELIQNLFAYASVELNEKGFDFRQDQVRWIEGAECRFKPTTPGNICVLSGFKSPFGEFSLEVQVTAWASSST